MSRVINVSFSEADVRKRCGEQGVLISAIEPLLSGGTRIVLTSAEGTLKMKRVFGDKNIIPGKVRRAPTRLMGGAY
ncbi:hypothetical protein [Sphingomonas sanxanigenens]|nr:hypothetical protein [Sphingomonas sanxanigenens]